jgi:hypothetical protein
VPLLAKGVAAKDLPGFCGVGLRMFVQSDSPRLPQLPLPEKIPIVKTSRHGGTQISVASGCDGGAAKRSALPGATARAVRPAFVALLVLRLTVRALRGLAIQ